MVNITINKTVEVSIFTQKGPQVADFVIIVIVSIGAFSLVVVECLSRRKPKEKDFDILENFQFSERNDDDYNSNRKLFPNSETQFQNYESNATNQDMLPDKGFNNSKNFEHSRMPSMGEKLFFFKKSTAHTTRPSQGGEGIELPEIRKSKGFGKVFPMEALTNGELTVREERKSDNDSTEQRGYIASLFNLGTNRSRKSNEFVRKFSVIAKGNQIMPTSGTTLNTHRVDNLGGDFLNP